MQQRVVLLGSAEIEPDAPQSVEGARGGDGDMGVIVPDEAAAEGGPVGGEGGGNDGYGGGKAGHGDPRTRRCCDTGALRC